MSQETSGSSRMTAWYVSKSGDASGPFATDMVLSMLRDGDLLPLDLVFREGETEWKPAVSFRELKTGNRPDSFFETKNSMPDMPGPDRTDGHSRGKDVEQSSAPGVRSLSWIVLRPHAGTYLQEGPFETQTIIDGLEVGRFQFSQYAWHVGMTQWMRIGDLREFDRRSRSRDSKPHVPPPLPDPIAAVLLEDDNDSDAEEFHVMMRGQLKHDLTPNPLASMQAMNVTQLGTVGMGGAAAESPEEKTAQAKANKAASLVSTPNLAGVPWEQDAADGYAQSVELIDDENSAIGFDRLTPTPAHESRNTPVLVKVEKQDGLAQLDNTPHPFVPPAPAPVSLDFWNKWGRYTAGAAMALVGIIFSAHLVTTPAMSKQKTARLAPVEPPSELIADGSLPLASSSAIADTSTWSPTSQDLVPVGAAPVAMAPVAAIPAEFSIVGLKLDRPDGQIVIQGSLPLGAPVAVTFKGRLGQILSKMSVRKTVGVNRKAGEIPTLRLKDLSLPAGSYTVEVDAGGLKAKNEIFVGVRDKKFLDKLETHLRDISLETQVQKKALFYAAKELDILARDLGQNYGQLRGKPEQWGAFFGKWNKKVESVQRSLVDLGKKSSDDQAFPEETAALFQAFTSLNDVATQYEQAIGQRRDVASDVLTELITELTRQRLSIGETTARPTADTPDGML